MATWTTFLAQVRRELEGLTTEDESILEWTNEAAADIAEQTRCLTDEQDANSVVGQQTYMLPYDTILPIILFYNGKRLQRETLEDWAAVADIEETGTPTHYALTPDALYLRPIPDAVGTMRYFRAYHPAAITSTTDTSAMPFEDKFNGLLRAYVHARASEQAGELTEQQMYQSRYTNGLAEAVYRAQRERMADLSSLPTEAD